MGKNMGILLLSIAVILSAATFLTTQTLDKSTNDAGFLMGHMTLKVIDENGYVRDYRQTDNVITLGGWNALVENVFSGTYQTGLGHVNGTGAGPFSHIGIGESSATALNTQTALGFELPTCPRSPIGIDSGVAIGSSGASITVDLIAGFDVETNSGCGGSTISEAGLFNGTAAQNTAMFARNTFTEVPELGSFDSIEILWVFTFNSPP